VGRRIVHYGNKHTYFESGGTWTKPAGLDHARVIVVGGGGGGGASGTTNNRVGGGGAGAGAGYKNIVAASLGATETVSVGAAGQGGAAGNNNGTAGGNSSFGSHLSAFGGGGGNHGAAAELWATGGWATGGDLNYNAWGAGGNGDHLEEWRGMGSAAAGLYNRPPGADSLESRIFPVGGLIGQWAGAGGVRPRANAGNAAGGPGVHFGGGGAGGQRVSASAAGGNGAPGVVVVYEYIMIEAGSGGGGGGDGVTSVTSDTNVTGSISGSNLTLGWNGTLSVARGGTGASSLTANRLLLGNGTGALQVLASGTSGQCLLSNGSSAPTWGSCSGGGGGGATNLQEAYNGGANIVLSSGNGGVRIQDASTPIGSNLFSVTNNAGTTNFFSVSATTTTVDNSFNANAQSTFRNASNSTTAFRIQNSGGVNLFTVDTTNSRITIGASNTTGELLVLGTKTGSGDPTGVNGGMYYNSNSGRFRCFQAGAWTDCIGGAAGGGSATTELHPEYAGAVLTAGTGSNNSGSMTSGFCSGSSRQSVNTTVCTGANDEHNYYSWTTSEATAQNYDIYVRHTMPSDMAAGSISGVQMSGWRSGGTSNLVELTMYNASGAVCGTTTNVATTDNTWTTVSYATSGTNCTAISAGDRVVFRVRMIATNGNYARAGVIKYNYTR
jgi:hypothetical protein